MRFWFEISATHFPRVIGATLGARRSVPHAGQVVSHGRQSELHGDFGQATIAKPPHPTLLLQPSEHGLHDFLASVIDGPPRRTAQLLPHATMRWLPRHAVPH